MSAESYPDHIIGLIGPAGAGKDEVAGFLEEQFGFTHLSLTDQLRQHLDERSEDASRLTLGTMGVQLREQHGEDVLFRECLAEWETRGRIGQAASVLVLSGHWSTGEFDAAKFAGAQFLNLAPPSGMTPHSFAKIRFARIRQRGAAKDKGISWEDFKERDRRERLGLNGQFSPYDQPAFLWVDDYKIDASKSHDDVHEQVAQAAAKVLAAPTAAEKRVPHLNRIRPRWDRETDEMLRGMYAEYQMHI